MHGSSLEQMKAMLDKLPLKRPLSVLDVGSYDVNGCYKPYFYEETYIGCDMRVGPNVTIVMDTPYKLPFEAGEFDLVISGQTLEHVEQPWRLVKEMGRVVKPGGYIIIIAPSAGPTHMATDAWRILPDGMKGMAEWAGLELVESYVIEALPWNDCVAVMKRGER